STIAVNRLGILEDGLDIMPRAVFEPLEEELLVARGAPDSALLLDDEQDRVAVAVEADLAHALDMSGGFALAPELFARARPVVRFARRGRAFERFAVHPAEHQHALRGGVLRDGRNQVELVPVHVVQPGHQLILISSPAAAITAFACPIVNSP